LQVKAKIKHLHQFRIDLISSISGIATVEINIMSIALDSDPSLVDSIAIKVERLIIEDKYEK